MNIFNFREVQWGPDEAKGDENLDKYFVTIPEFEAIKRGEYRYIIGRKGTGKTAIIEKIKLDSKKNPLSFYSALSLRNFPLNSFRALRDKSFRDKSQYTPIWLFLIYIEICKMILEDNGAGPVDLINELKTFLLTNHFLQGKGFVDTVSILKNCQAKIKVLSKWLGGNLNISKQSQAMVTIHYQNVIEHLEKKILSIYSDSIYWLFIDELDEGYRADDKGLRLILLSLFRATEDAVLNLKNSNLNFRPILVLRSDIFDSLEDNDLNKLDDYTLRLRWISHIDHTDYSLKSIPNARIKFSIPTLSEYNDPWRYVVKDDDVTSLYNVKSLWSFMANRTYERPRDIIKFLKYCRKFVDKGQLTLEHVKKAEDNYSNWLYNELRDEIHSYLPIWKNALQVLTKIGKGKLTITEYKRLAERDKKILQWLKDHNKSIEEILEILFDFGVIGNLDDKRWIFKYKDHDLPFDEHMEIIVHFGLKKKLRIK